MDSTLASALWSSFRKISVHPAKLCRRNSRQQSDQDAKAVEVGATSSNWHRFDGISFARPLIFALHIARPRLKWVKSNRAALDLRDDVDRDI